MPRKAKRQRAKAELEMQEYLAKMRVPIQELIAGLRKGEVSLVSDRSSWCDWERLSWLAYLWHYCPVHVRAQLSVYTQVSCVHNGFRTTSLHLKLPESCRLRMTQLKCSKNLLLLLTEL